MTGYMYDFFSKLLGCCSFSRCGNGNGNGNGKEPKIHNKRTTVLTSEEIVNNIRTYGIL